MKGSTLALVVAVAALSGYGGMRLERSRDASDGDESTGGGRSDESGSHRESGADQESGAAGEAGGVDEGPGAGGGAPHAADVSQGRRAGPPAAASAETQEDAQRTPGFWHAARAGDRVAPDLLAAEALGYIEAHHEAPMRLKVVQFDEERAQPGYNLYCSGHAAEGYLIDMTGKVQHQWALEPEEIWDDFASVERSNNFRYWRKLHAFENGDLLLVVNNVGIVRIDAQSNLLWERRAGAHHDFCFDDEGHVFVLEQEVHVIPRVHKTMPCVEDMVAELDAAGNLLDRFSVLECFEQSEYAHMLRKMPKHWDLFHTNTLQMVDGQHAGRSDVFKKGNLLVSLCHLDTVAIIDPKARRAVWAATGKWTKQHEPVLLDNGNILLFNNYDSPFGDPTATPRSQAIEFDPFGLATAWSYPPAGQEATFFSAWCGSVQRLPNGNTLITESDYGRVFEVVPDGTVVWEYLSPHRAGEDGELIAIIPEMLRLPPEFPVETFADAR